MRRNARRFALTISLSLTSLLWSAEPSEEIVLCDLGVTRSLSSANASFSVIYRLDVSSTGSVTKVSKLRNDFLPDSMLQACLSRWRFTGQQQRTVITIFEWKHGQGWDSVAITDGGTTRRIRFGAGWARVHE